MKFINEIKEISIYTLKQECVKFLESVGTVVESRCPNVTDGIPVYLRNGDEVSIIYDFILKDNKLFEKNAMTYPVVKIYIAEGEF